MNASITERKRTSFVEFAAERLIRGSGIMAIVFVFLIFAFLLREGLPAFTEVPLGDLFSMRWYPTENYFGILPLIFGSLVVTIGAAIIAMPIGLLTAIFVAEIAPRWLREILKPMIEVVAGIPSVVLGFFGVVILSSLVRETLNLPTGLTAFTGSLILAYMALPTIVSVAEDALDAVPRSYRDAALALGATKWQTIWLVTVKAAKSGILTAMMLGVGRAIGETMAVLMVTGNAARVALDPGALFMPVRTMTATIAAEMGEVAQGSTHFHVLFAIGIVLFVITFLVNLVASFAIFRQSKRAARLLS
ncbi:MAG TPA: phosphate ABC transporter permease subunit PstC [Anaerolineae bacterium]|nr:phosphate ABC transporter permease subunit PstC [Anaerolineae bacterium]